MNNKTKMKKKNKIKVGKKNNKKKIIKSCTRTYTYKKMKLGPNSIPFIKINSKWIKCPRDI
jgi:hypothetical protein